MSQQLFLKVSHRGREIENRRFDQDQVVLGRGPEADVQLDNAGVSRSHAVIKRSNGRFVLVDQGSSNGTLVKGTRVAERQLRNGDRIQISKFVIAVEIMNDIRSVAGAAPRSLMPADPTMRADDVNRPEVVDEDTPVETASKSRATLLISVLAIGTALAIAAIVGN